MTRRPTPNVSSRVERAVPDVLTRDGRLTWPALFRELGILSERDLAAWRAGRVDYLERVVRSNLTRLARFQTAVRREARRRGLVRRIAPPPKVRGRVLRYSKSGNLFVEEEYRAVYAPPSTVTESCADCGAPSRIRLSNVPVCDRCYNRRVAALTGYPDIPNPPTRETIVGPDGRRHHIRYRLLRGPAGIEAWAEEEGGGPGYRFEIVGSHDDDPGAMAAAMKDRVRREVGRLYLEDVDGQWHVAGHDIAGRIEEDYDDEEGWLDVPRVVVDGRAMSWVDFGRALKSFVGWEFRLELGEEMVYRKNENAVPLRAVPEELEDDEAFLAQWDEADRRAVEILREALRDYIGRSVPAEALQAAAARIRGGIAAGTWPFEWIGRGAGLRRGSLPAEDAELILRCLAGIISLEEETGLGTEVDASIMTLEHADWLGPAVMFPRRGEGARADAAAFAETVDECPEVEETLDPDDAEVIEHSFTILLPAFEAIGVVDESERLTELGAWVLPRAVARAWNGDFDT